MIYILLFFTNYLLFKTIDNSKNKKQIHLILIIFLTINVTICGFRDFGIGTDTITYIEDYFNYSSRISSISDFINVENKDLGFLSLGIITNYFSNDSHLMLTIIAFLYFSCILKGFIELYSLSIAKGSIFIILFCLTLYNPSLNYMRQFCALSILWISYVYLYKQEYNKYLIFQIFAFFFHSSSIIFILLPIFHYISTLSKKIQIILSLTFLIIIILAVKSFNHYLSYIEFFGDKISIYAMRYGDGGSLSENGTNLFGPSLIAFIIIVYIIYYISLKKKIINHGEFYISTMSHTVYIALMFLSMYSVDLHRISYYFIIIDIFYLTIILSFKNNIKYIKSILIIILCYMWYSNYIVSKSCETYPYKSELLGI